MPSFRTALATGAISIALAATAASASTRDDDVSVITRQSREFSDASASGKLASIARYLDDDVTFVNEDGSFATKSDFAKDRPPQPAATTSLAQTHFVVRLFGDTAVTSFTDVNTTRAYGQTTAASFLSTETWKREADGWKMIQSETQGVNRDPPAVALPAADLDAYAGTYRVGPGLDVVVRRDGSGLTTSSNGGPPARLEAEVRDVFFRPGQFEVRRIFVRDASGAIVGYVTRRFGVDVMLKRLSG